MPCLPGKHFVFHLIVKQNNTVLVLTLSYTLTHLLLAPISIQIITGQAAPSKLSFVAFASHPLVMANVVSTFLASSTLPFKLYVVSYVITCLFLIKKKLYLNSMNFFIFKYLTCVLRHFDVFMRHRLLHLYLCPF